MDTFEKLDKVDLQILRTLQENAGQSFIDSCFRAP